jgi:hypothetical protein
MKRLVFASCFSVVASLTILNATPNGTGTATLLRVPDGGVQPKAVAEASGKVHLVYLKGDPKACDVFYATREAGRTNFAKPICVNNQPGSAIAVGTVRGADIALGRWKVVHIAWNGPQPPGASDGSPMLYARVLDGGDQFEPQRNLMTSTKHLDGGGSVAADTEGNVYVVWHGHRRNGPQDEQHRAVFLARSSDDGKTFAPEQEVSPAGSGACGCCGLKAFADASGRLAILYRAANAAGNRDVTLLVSKDHGKSFQSSVLGPWKISMCPMSTMSLGQGKDGKLLAAWETAGQVWYSTIGGNSGDSTTPVAASGKGGQRKHPALAAGTKGTENFLAWTEGTAWAKGGSLAWERTDSGESGRAEGVPVWGSVTAVAEPDGGFTVIY